MIRSFFGRMAVPALTMAACCGAAPNLVPNPSFDSPQICPTGVSQLATASPPWFSGANTPDTFNSCAPGSSDASVPKNWRGKQTTHSGTGYAGFLAYYKGVEEREYIEVQLISPLVAGQTYTVTYFLSLGDRSKWMIGTIGAYFSTAPVFSSNGGVIPCTPQVVSNQGWLNDNDGWMQVTGSFVANGGEEFLTIGNFTPDSALQVARSPGIQINGDDCSYYIDDVSVVCDCSGPPSIQTDPTSQTVPCGQGATLAAAPSPTTCINSMQWSCDDCFASPTALTDSAKYFSGTSTPALTLTPLAVTTFKGKTFRLSASNDCGTATSQGATVAPITPPITLEPSDVFICPPQTTSFTVAAAGSGWKYQWYWTAPGARPVPFAAYQGGNSPTLNFEAWPGLCDATVHCVLTSPCGTNISRAAKINCCSCTPPPTNMALWLPFDQISGTGVTRNVVSGYGGVLRPLSAPPFLYSGWLVDNSMWFDGATQYVTVQNHDLVDVTDGDLTLDAWIFIEGVYPGVSTIIDKRLETSSSTTGYHLFLQEIAGAYRLGFQLADGTFTNWLTPATVALPQGWRHIAVTVRRNVASGGRFYVDGQPVAMFDPTAHQGSLSNPSPFTVAARSTTPSAFFHTAIDEVELFRRALSAAEIAALYNAKGVGKCKQFVQASPATVFCKDATSTTIGATLFNFTASAATFTGTFDKSSCPLTPPNLSVAVPPTTVGAWSWAQVSTTASKPGGMITNDTACYLANFKVPVRTSTGRGLIVNRPDLLCSSGVATIIKPVPLNGASTVSFSLGNASTPSGLFPYRVRAIGPDGRTSQTLSIAGLPAGEALLGLATIPLGETRDVTVEVGFAGVEVLGITTLMLSTDLDGDGAFEPAATVPLICELKVPPQCCPADFNCDGFVDYTDFDDFIAAFAAGDLRADVSGDGFLDFGDVDVFTTLFEIGCRP